MIMVEQTSCEAIVFTIVLRELERERTVSRTLTIPLCTLISWFALLATIAVKNVDTVTIWIVSLSSLRDELDIHWRENVIDSFSNDVHVLKRLVLEIADIDVYFQLVILFIFHCCLCS